jgi:hypothetical protein
LKQFTEAELEVLLNNAYARGKVDQQALHMLRRFGNGFNYVEKRAAQLKEVSIRTLMESV